MKHIQKRQALIKAIKLAGSQKALADICGKRQQAVTYWLKKGLPLKHVLTIEKKLNHSITRYELAPDFFDLTNDTCKRLRKS